ncbi:MAG: hypothetical protein M1542_00080 [Thermotogae bacterium]|nr:hypothetical protein [Thermotogota bacterium]
MFVHFSEKYFGTFFCDLDDFYLNDLLVLVRGIISKKSSTSSMSKDALDIAHITLTRFINEHAQFWSKLDKEII